MTKMLPTKAAFQVSRAAIATTAMVISAQLAATGSGGALLSLLPRMPGSAAYTISLELLRGTTSLRRTVCLSVVSGIKCINLFGFLII